MRIGTGGLVPRSELPGGQEEESGKHNAPLKYNRRLNSARL